MATGPQKKRTKQWRQIKKKVVLVQGRTKQKEKILRKTNGKD